MLWRLVFRCRNSDEEAGELVGLGVAGVEIVSRTEAVCYLEGEKERCEEFACAAKERGLELVSAEPQEESNWHSGCPELWESFTVGELEVIPVKGAEETRELERSFSGKHLIRIVPGEGFGTGHHRTTNSLLGYLQESAVRAALPKKVLDVGTGSGLLSIAAVLLYSCHCDAVDTDSGAIKNARENCSLNGVLDNVRLICGSTGAAEGSYDLIMANIYAEILSDASSDLERLLSPRGLLLLSGIMEEKLSLIEAAYPETCWEKVLSSIEEGWVSLVLRRVS